MPPLVAGYILLEQRYREERGMIRPISSVGPRVQQRRLLLCLEQLAVAGLEESSLFTSYATSLLRFVSCLAKLSLATSVIR